MKKFEFIISLAFYLIASLEKCSILCFNLKLNPISTIDLTFYNQTFEIMKNIFNYPQRIDVNERFKLLQVDKNYFVLGARNRLLTVVTDRMEQIQIYESFFPIREKSFQDRDCPDRNCANYVLLTLPITQNDKYNLLICGTYYGLFQCIQATQNKENGKITFYDMSMLIKAPKSISLPLSNQNAYYLSTITNNTSRSDSQFILYSASSWTDNSQYLAAHTSESNYQDESSNKKIGVSKSFVRFIETNNKLYLFQNEFSYDIDDGERDRDILVSTSLVTQICKNDQEILNREPAFYTELTAKIYCFNDAFRSNSGNSRNFKFDTLEFVTDLINFRDSQSNQTKRLFYGVFNTPKNQITGTAICFFDVNDLSSVFQKQNFKYLDDNNENNAKNTQFNPQDCPNVSFLEKFKYRSFTSKLSYMTKAALPIKKRRASFITTNEYRISSLLVIDKDTKINNQIYPLVKEQDNFNYLNIILAGTDNGKLMRIAHYFGKNYFDTEDVDQEHVEILEEIQLFDKNIIISEIQILNSEKDKKIFAISNNQIKSISVDFCQLYSSSCERCLLLNKNPLFSTKCVWTSSSCTSLIESKDTTRYFYYSQIENCEILKPTTSTTTTKLKSTLTNSLPIKQLQISKNDTLSTLITTITTSTAESIKTIKSKNTNLFTNFASKELSNISSLLIQDVKMGPLNRSEFYLTKKFKQQEDHLIVYIIVSILVSAAALIIGILIGYLIKSNYTKLVKKKFENKFNSGKKTNFDINDNNALGSKYQSNIYSGLNDIAKIRLAQKPVKCLDNNDKEFDNPNASYESSTKYSDASNDLTTTSSNNSSRNNSYNKNYFTIQNSYGILPKQNLKTSSSPIYIANRLSSTSSSVDSNYGMFNLISSQTCLINNKSKNSSNLNPTISEINNEKKSMPCQTILLNAERPPLVVNRFSNQRCLVVNDDEEHEEFEIKTKVNELNQIQKRHSYLSSSSSFTPSSSRQLESVASSTSNNSNWSSISSKGSKYQKRHHVRKINSISYTDPSKLKNEIQKVTSVSNLTRNVDNITTNMTNSYV